MSRKWIQVFSAGWFLAVCVIAIVYYSATFSDHHEATDTDNNKEADKPPAQEELDEKSAIKFLEEKNYEIMTAAELKELQKEETPPPATKALLHIEEGMSSSDVASLLERLQIVKEPDAFKKALEESGKETSIQAGTYELNNQMSHEDMIKLFTS